MLTNSSLLYPADATVSTAWFKESWRTYPPGTCPSSHPGYADDFARRDQQTLAKQVKEWLDENFTTQITYKIFQDLFNLNEKYISTLFKAEYNITPSRYVEELRLNMAKNLMQNNPEIRVKDVAELVGFTDYFYFSRVFKSHEGVTPSQYIKSISTTDSAPKTE